MADLTTLDIVYAGLPYVDFGQSRSGSDGLDYVYAGLPWWAETIGETLLAAGSNTITLTAGSLQVQTIERRYPGKRSEFVGETQDKHITPPFNIQYPEYLP